MKQRRLVSAIPILAVWKLVALIVALTAVIFALLYWAEEIPAGHTVLKNVLQSFAALLLTSGIVSVVANILVRNELTTFWMEAIGIRDSVVRGGLWDIGLDFHSYDFHTLIREASKIDIFVIHGDKWFSNRLNDFKTFLSHRDHELRVCLLDGEGEIATHLSEDFHYKSGELAQRTANTIECLHSCIIELERVGQSTGWIRIWKHKRAPKHTYYRFDDKLLLVPYNQAQGHTTIPVIGFMRKSGGVSDFLADDFDRMLADHAVKVYDSRERTQPPVAAPESAGMKPEPAT